LINSIRASDYRFADKTKYYVGFENARKQKKDGTKIRELRMLADTATDFTESDEGAASVLFPNHCHLARCKFLHGRRQTGTMNPFLSRPLVCYNSKNPELHLLQDLIRQMAPQHKKQCNLPSYSPLFSPHNSKNILELIQR
jgi:hypothetical protein